MALLGRTVKAPSAWPDPPTSQQLRAPWELGAIVAPARDRSSFFSFERFETVYLPRLAEAGKLFKGVAILSNRRVLQTSPLARLGQLKVRRWFGGSWSVCNRRARRGGAIQ
jgi:hypothetical protein